MSKIEWTGKTWNPVVGCDKISAGCKNCYAIRMAYRLMHNPKMAGKYQGTAMKTAGGELNWTGKINTLPDTLTLPMTWTKPTMVFVNSMSDLFHEAIPFEFISAVFSVMSDINIHTYQVLTKRPARMVEFFKWMQEAFGFPWQPSSNVWLGVSVEDQKAADERIPLLLQVPAAVRFLSCEPLLGPIDLSKYYFCTIPGKVTNRYPFKGLQENEKTKWINLLNWVIAGGESGPGSRPMHPDWARGLRDQCKAAGVPFFFKQWGEWGIREKPHESESDISPCEKHERWLNAAGGHGFHGEEVYRVRKVGKKKAGRLLDGQLHNQMPNVIRTI